MKKILVKALCLGICLLLIVGMTACGEKSKSTGSNKEDSISSVETSLPDSSKDTQNDSSSSDVFGQDDTSSDVSTNEQTQHSNNSSQKVEDTSENQSTHKHNFSVATCTKAKMCSCGATEGKALGHKWNAATCTKPKTCSVCNTIEGNSLSHEYKAGKCIVCNAKDPNFMTTPITEKIGGWVMFHECEDGECICRFYFSLYNEEELYFGGDICTLYDPWPECQDKFEYNGDSYCIDLSDYDQLESIEEDDGIITIFDWSGESKIEFKRLDENSLVVEYCDEDFSISSGICGCILSKGMIFRFVEGEFPWQSDINR